MTNSALTCPSEGMGGTPRQEANLYEKAIRGGWNLTSEQRHQIVDRLMEILSSGRNREAVAAARALIACDVADLQRERLRGDLAHSDDVGPRITIRLQDEGDERTKHFVGKALRELYRE